VIEVGIKPDVKHYYQGECRYEVEKGWACQIFDDKGDVVDVVGSYPTKTECREATLKRVIQIVKGLEGKDEAS